MDFNSADLLGKLTGTLISAFKTGAAPGGGGGGAGAIIRCIYPFSGLNPLSMTFP